MMPKAPVLLFALLLTPVFHSFHPQSGKDAPESIFELLQQEEVLKVDLTTDLQLLADNKKTVNYQPATFTFELEKERKYELSIELRTRGRYRRRICQFPPLKLKFDKEELKGLNLKKHNELKLVTHCLDSPEGEENILREYLIYKLYEKISPEHYRTQLVRVRYVDTGSNTRITGYGILLEDESELSSRLDAQLCEDCFSQPKASFDQTNLHTQALFQYMIGNTDWSIPMLRNLKLVKRKATGSFYAVPYDFDFSGLVNASYAIPEPTLNLPTVRTRHFQGMADSQAELQPVADHFLAKKEEILSTVENFKLLSRTSRLDIREYLESFYLTLEQGNVLEKLKN